MKRTEMIVLTLLLVIAGMNSYLTAQHLNWEMAVQVEGTGNRYNHIALDSMGNTIVAGSFTGSAQFGDTRFQYVEEDAYVAKLGQDGNWIWATRSLSTFFKEEGPYACYIKKIVVDSNDQIYVAGEFSGSVQFGATRLIHFPDLPVFIGHVPFVARLNRYGEWIWAVQGYVGGSDLWGAQFSTDGLTLDNEGNVYLTGTFNRRFRFGDFVMRPIGETDIFVAKISPWGEWEWVVRAGGDSRTKAYDLVSDGSSNLYVTGRFSNLISFGNIEVTATGSADVFLAKITNNGAWRWAVRAGNVGSSRGTALAVDDFGDVYVAGTYQNLITFGTIHVRGGRQFVAKADSDGSWLMGENIGNGDTSAITVDSVGNLHVTGNFRNSITLGFHQLVSDNDFGMFWAVANRERNWIRAESIVCTGEVIPFSIITGDDSSIHIGGFFREDIHFGDFRLNTTGRSSFIARANATLSVEDTHTEPLTAHISNFPNPFNPETVIKFNIPTAQKAEINIYNVRGQLVTTLLDDTIQAGEHQIPWNGRDDDGNEQASGVYWYRLETADEVRTGKMVLVK